MFSFSKTKDELIMTQILQNKTIIRGVVSHGASKEPEVYLELSQTSTRERFCKTS